MSVESMQDKNDKFVEQINVWKACNDLDVVICTFYQPDV